MVKGCRVPPLCRVAIRAIGRRERGTSGRVHWVVRFLPGTQMAACVATIAQSDLQIVVVIDMTQCARDVSVAIGQWKSCRVVVEFRSQPTVHGVTRLASSREARADVVWSRRPLIILEMTRDAGRW